MKIRALWISGLLLTVLLCLSTSGHACFHAGITYKSTPIKQSGQQAIIIHHTWIDRMKPLLSRCPEWLS